MGRALYGSRNSARTRHAEARADGAIDEEQPILVGPRAHLPLDHRICRRVHAGDAAAVRLLGRLMISKVIQRPPPRQFAYINLSTHLRLQLVRPHLKQRAHQTRRPGPALQPQDGGGDGRRRAVDWMDVERGVGMSAEYGDSQPPPPQQQRGA